MDEAFLNDLLECSVCLEQLDGNSKVLPCQHTFCKRCLEEIVHSHKELRCPECRVRVDTKVEDLPPNILLMRLLEGIKNNPRLKPPSVTPKKKETSVPSQSLSPPKASRTENNTKPAAPVLGEHTKTVIKQLHAPPSAKAMFNYEGKEPGDLSFKKGDMILLQRRIDQNWYHGEVNGKYGFVPARYVRVVVPLPTHVPQCKALYDFSVAENEEKDCLTFKKGEIITVIRRVDDNWAEGKSEDRIGIFPISFVEMNVAARSLMKLSVNTQPGPSRLAPPTPMSSSQVLIPPNSKTSTTTTSLIVESLSSTTTPSPSSSTTPSPGTPPSSDSPASLPVSTPAALSIAKLERLPFVLRRSASQRTSHQREKRHSLSSITSASQKMSHIPITQKHSSEILSTSGGDILAAPNRAIPESAVSSASPSSPVTTKDGVEEVTPRVAHRHVHRTMDVSKELVTVTAATSTTTTVTTSKSSSTSSQGAPLTLYVALYNYRPQKDDELELKKGDLYTVSEKCQDGWFKGFCLRSSKTGVFPGNYVNFASKSSHPGHVHQYSSVANVRSTSSKSMLPVASVPPPRQKPPSIPLAPTATSSASGLASSVYSMEKKALLQEPKTSVAAGLLEWARSVTAAANSPQKPQYASTNQDTSKENTGTLSHTSVPKPSDSLYWVSNIQVASTASITASPSLASHMSISYPMPLQLQNDNLPTDKDSSSISQSWHAGKAYGASMFPSHNSVPLMAVVPPPNVSLRASASGHSSAHSKQEKLKTRKDKTRDGLIKRFTGKKKTPLPIPNFSCDNPSFVDSPTSQSSVDIVHSRSGSCPVDVLTGQPSNQPQSSAVEVPNTDASKLGSRLKQPSLVRERFRCVVPYPPNSEYELELKTGDVVYVHKKRDDGWYKGTLLRTGKTGLFPATFVVSF